MKKIAIIFSAVLILCCKQISAQGTWAAVTNMAPDQNGGVMLLLTDGTVITKTFSGGSDGYGNLWNKLTPDMNGSYKNGTWTTIAPMYDTRLYFASQVLKDGRVFVAGAEYGTGKSLAEVYNPITDSWIMTPIQPQYFGDSNSELLPDGKVLVGILQKPPLKGNSDSTLIYNPKTNSWAIGPKSIGSHDEAAWVKLPDSSILFVDDTAYTSERFIPSLNQWVNDATVPVQMYDPYGAGETGAAFLLPDGRAFFLGAMAKTAYYTPSGNASQGTWVAGPTIPNSRGATDAAAAMLVNGKILCAVSPIPTSSVTIYNSPTYFYEFNYLTNSFTQVGAPGGGTSVNEPCFNTNMLDLPDGTVLYADQGANQYYIYTPTGSPLASGKPTIGNITQTLCDTFRITGTLFNGISEGAAYGDDWQMATNYPIVRLTSGANVYYARSFDWNSTGVMRGSLPDTAFFSVSAAVPAGTYSLVVIANGISSNPSQFIYSPCNNAVEEATYLNKNILVYPNPSNNKITIQSSTELGVIIIYNSLGEKVYQSTIHPSACGISPQGEKITTIDISKLPSGVYTINVQNVYKKIIKE